MRCFYFDFGIISKERFRMSICKKYNCQECPSFKECGGCENCNAKPFDSKEQCICARIINIKGFRDFQETFQRVIDSINALSIEGLHADDMNILPGSLVNLEYPLPSGGTIKFLNDDLTYFANQIEIDGEKCYGVVSDGTFLLVSSYGPKGKDPELLVYKKL